MSSFRFEIKSEFEKSFGGQTTSIKSLINRKVLITGGTGFVGTWIAAAFDYLYEIYGGSGHLTVVSRKSNSHLHNLISQNGRIKHIPCDVRELRPGQFSEFDLVIHAATPSSQLSINKWERELSSIIIEGQEALLKSLGENQPKFIFLSSGAVYGDTRGIQTPISENDFFGVDPLASNIYRESKRIAEHRLLLAHNYNEISLIVQRLFAFHGPLLPWDQHFAVGNFLNDVSRGKIIKIDSDGLSTRSYLYASDMAAWVLCIAELGEVGTAYNVGSGVPITIKELANEVNHVLGGVGVEVNGAPRPIDQIDYYVPDVSKSESLGLRATIQLDEGIKSSFRWGSSS